MMGGVDVLSGVFTWDYGDREDVVRVEIVVQFFKVGEIDTLKEQFNADVIVKAKWREPTLDGQNNMLNDSLEFARLWNPKLYIENSLGDPKEQIRHKLVFNDKGEASIHEKRVAKGTFMENLELDDFPFDVQDLTVTVASELPASEVELIEDREEHHVVNRQSFVDEQEWHLYVHTECNKKELVIDQSDNSVKRSALSVKCRAARRPGYFVWNIFMITFMICSLGFATFSVDKTLPEFRLQISFTLVLTSVMFKFAVTASLPRISYLTLMFMICSLGFATFSVDKTLPEFRLQISFTLVLTSVMFKFAVTASLPRISYLTLMFMICSLGFATFSVDKKLPENRLQISFTLVLTSVMFKFAVTASLPRISYLTLMFLICSLAFATFSVDKEFVQNRLQLTFTLVLTAVAFKSVVNSSLPRISYLTYMDKYLLASMVMLSAVCTWHAIVTRLLYDRPYADRVENIVLTILGILYFLFNIGFIVIIYLFPCKKRRIMAQKDKEYKDNLNRSQVAKYKRKPRRQAIEQQEGIQVTAKY